MELTNPGKAIEKGNMAEAGCRLLFDSDEDQMGEGISCVVLAGMVSFILDIVATSRRACALWNIQRNPSGGIAHQLRRLHAR